MVGGMLRDPAVMRRRLREGVEFFRFLRTRRARSTRGSAGGLDRRRVGKRAAMRALFVCRGNICRSRVAEQIFQVLTWSVAGRGEPRGAVRRCRPGFRRSPHHRDVTSRGPT